MRRTIAVSAIVVLTAGLAVPAPARAAESATAATTAGDEPVVELGLTAGARISRVVDLRPDLSAFSGVIRVSLYANHRFVAWARTSPWSLRWDTTGITDEDVAVYMIVDHAGGSTTTAPISVRVDNYAPMSYFLLDGKPLMPSDISFSGTVDLTLAPRNDAETVRRIELLADGSVVDTANAAPWHVTWDTSLFPEGEVRLTARTYDDLGNATDYHLWPHVDRTGPALSVEFPGTKGHVSVHQAVAVSAQDRAGVDRVELYLNGTLAGADRTGGGTNFRPVRLTLPAGTPGGVATMTVKAYDEVGNVTDQTRTVVVDNDKPVATGTPAATHLRGVFTAGLTGFRDASGPAYLAAYLDDRRGTGSTHQDPWNVRVDSRAVADGRHILTWDVMDRAGNFTHLRRTVHVDNTVPSVAYTKAPKNRAKLSGPVTIKVGASDRYGVGRVQLLVNGKVVATDSKAGYAFTLSPKKYGRTLSVQVRAYDRAGNVKYTAKRTYRR